MGYCLLVYVFYLKLKPISSHNIIGNTISERYLQASRSSRTINHVILKTFRTVFMIMIRLIIRNIRFDK